MKNHQEQKAMKGSRDPRTGPYLRDARKARGLTQEGLARLLGVCERTIKDWERNGIPERGMARTHNIIREVLLINSGEVL